MNLNYHEKKTIIKTTFKEEPQKDDYHLLNFNREYQVILFRLRTGHNGLHHHMNKRFKLLPSVSAMRETRLLSMYCKDAQGFKGKGGGLAIT